MVDLSQNGNHDGCGRRIEEGKVTAMSKGLKGEYNHSVDSKGRMIVPSKLREQLGLSFVVTRGMDGCLFAYPNDEWEIFEGKLRQLPMTNENSRKFKRFFQAGAADCEVDNQGRILLPAEFERVCRYYQGCDCGWCRRAC